MHLLFFKNILFIFSFLGAGNIAPEPAGQKISREEYFDKYRDVAVEDMHTSGVPASITLAQGAFESDNGNSPLATEANNHFGIKCHDWTGKKYFHDDDLKQECFRVYPTALASYNDHSYFLKSRSRYSFLFNIPRTDYKAWAYGLKKAGYATSPVYAEKLIQIIEDYKLFELDEPGYTGTHISSPKAERIEKTEKKPETFIKEHKETSPPVTGIQLNNGVKFISVQKGDSYEKIERQYDIRPWQLYKYNDLSRSSGIAEGQKIYLQPKRRKPQEEFHTVQPGESMYTISQRYAVKLKLLYRRNRMERGEPLKIGQRLWLKYKKKKDE